MSSLHPPSKTQYAPGSCRKTQLVANLEDVGKHEKRIEMSRILFQSAISHFHISPLAFDDLKRMLDL